jgi:UPF0716 protein FxsA
LAFLIIPITELYLLFALADVIGGLATLAIVIGTAFIGINVLRRQGLNTLTSANQRLRSGDLPGQEIIEGMLLAIAGVMLISPGLITDTIGFVLLTPFIRKGVARRIMVKGLSGANGIFMGGFYRGGGQTRGGYSAHPDGDIIDGEVVDRDQPREGESAIPRQGRDPY